MSRWAVAVVFVVFAGCGSDVEPTSEWADSSLQPPSVEPVEELVAPQLDVLGGLRIDGAGLDLDVSILPTGGTTARVHVALHTPTNPDLFDYNEDDGVLMSLREESGGVSLALRDAAGDVLYLMEPVQPGSLTEELFGTGTVAEAEDLGPVSDPTWKVRLSSAFLRTDTGDVELFPGEPLEVTMKGLAYRAILISAYTMEESSPTCIEVIEERLSFELILVEPGSVDPAPMLRPEEVSLTGAICPPA